MGARDLPRTLSAVLLAAATWTAVPGLAVQEPAPQLESDTAPDTELGPRERLERHTRGVYLARRLEFEERWEAADDAARARARAVLDALPGEAAFTPSARVLASARRALSGQVETDATRLVDSIDLRTLPGAFEPTERTRGEPIVALVRGLFPVRSTEPRESELVLTWRGPNGDEVRAGRETVHSSALTTGFEVYLHAPAARAGTWHLEPSIEAARGFPVPVECIPDVRARYAEVRAQRIASGRPAGGALLLALEHGIRPISGTSIASMLAEGEPAPGGRAVRDAQGEVLAYELEPEQADTQEEQAVVLLETSRFEDPAWSFAGQRGAAWRALGRAADCRVVAAARPSALVGYLRAERRTLVMRTAAAMRAPDPAFDRWVVLGRAGSANVPEARARPMLVVELGSAQQAVEESEDELTIVRLTEPAALADVVAPRWIARWLRGEL